MESQKYWSSIFALTEQKNNAISTSEVNVPYEKRTIRSHGIKSFSTFTLPIKNVLTKFGTDTNFFQAKSELNTVILDSFKEYIIGFEVYLKSIYTILAFLNEIKDSVPEKNVLYSFVRDNLTDFEIELALLHESKVEKQSFYLNLEES